MIMTNFIETQLQQKEKELKFRFNLQESSNIVIVEMITPGNTSEDIELTASHICLANNISPLRLIYFIEENGEWQMIQFTEFYNEKCRIFSKERVDLQEIEHLMN